jgi:hypothetical protein
LGEWQWNPCLMQLKGLCQVMAEVNPRPRRGYSDAASNLTRVAPCEAGVAPSEADVAPSGADVAMVPHDLGIAGRLVPHNLGSQGGWCLTIWGLQGGWCLTIWRSHGGWCLTIWGLHGGWYVLCAACCVLRSACAGGTVVPMWRWRRPSRWRRPQWWVCQHRYQQGWSRTRWICRPRGKISAAADVGDVVGFQVASLRRMSASKSIKRGV